MINIVLTAAGLGTRFADSGYECPKPLIDVLGEPMYAWALRSLPLSLSKRIVVIGLSEHLEGSGFRGDIEERLGGRDVEVIGVHRPTEGQACTALMAGEWIDEDTPLIIHNADTYFVSDLRGTLEAAPFRDGVISVFRDANPKWSFVRTDADGRVLEVAEKQPISDLATTGMYYFGSGRSFVKAAEDMIRRNLRVHGEFYIAPVYNLLIEGGSRIGVDFASEVYCFGSPEDLRVSVRRLARRPGCRSRDLPDSRGVDRVRV